MHTLLYDPDGTFPEFRDARVVTSPLDRIGPLRRNHRLALPVLAPAASRMTVDADVTIVSTSGWAHGFDVRGRSVVYCHNPARWLYQGDDYLGRASPPPDVPGPGACSAPPLRRWDRRAAMRRHDRYLVDSTVVRERIRATYGIDADDPLPAHPWSATWTARRSRSAPSTPGSTCVVSRLLPYKNVDQAVAAFREPARRTSPGDRPRSRGGAAAARDARRTWRSSPTSATTSCAGPTRTASRLVAPSPRGLRADPAGGRGLRQADAGAAGRRLPGHGGRGDQRALLRAAEPPRTSPRRC